MFTKKIKNSADVWSNTKKFINITVDPDKAIFNINHRKENNFYCGYKVLNFGEKNFNGDFAEAIDVSFYYTKTTCYCCLWINAGDVSTRGSGCASGYGYDRKSSAFEEAINNAGIFNFPRFGESGDNRFAIDILCKIFNIKKYQVIEIFG